MIDARSLFSPTACVLMLSSVFFGASASAEDEAPVLPPPSKVADAPQDRQTVSRLPAENEGNLSKELSAPESDGDVQIYSSTRDDGTKIEEYSRHGRVYMVKVTPPHGLPSYYLYDNNGDGQFERRIMGNYKRPSPPQWVIQRF